jgi:hypothetical protein
MNQGRRILIALDQLGNTLAQGNEDCTISARLGYLYLNRPQGWTTWLMRFVDFIFYPLDGGYHCVQSYYFDQDESFIRGSDVGLAIVTVFVVVVCVVLYPFILIISLWKRLR